ncbi:MAG: DsbA family protein [Halobacteriota archaeon]
MSNRTRRDLLGASSSLLLVTFAGCASIADRTEGDRQNHRTDDQETPGASGSSGLSETRTDEPDAPERDDGVGTQTNRPPSTAEKPSIEPSEVSFSTALLPDAPGDHAFPRLGDDDAPTATVFGNWKCPYTREFVLTWMPEIVAEFVEPGDVALEFRTVSWRGGEPLLGADAPRASRAGVAVWDTDPEAYWSYFATVFTNQPAEREEWATTERLMEFAEAAGVSDAEAVERAIRERSYFDEVRRATERAGRRGIGTVPRVATADEVTAPTVDIEQTRRQLADEADDGESDGS